MTIVNSSLTQTKKSALSKEPNRYSGPRLMVVRFSSFGDILQAISVIESLRSRFASGYESDHSVVDWYTRSDFAPLLRPQPHINHVFELPRKAGIFSLVAQSWRLSRNHYTHLYDAHSNTRSHIVVAVFRARQAWSWLSFKPKRLNVVRRSKQRFRRWLFFRFRFSTLPSPYRGAMSFLTPLREWGVSTAVLEMIHFHAPPLASNSQAQRQIDALRGGPIVALAPGAAWPMKRWPVQHWVSLVEKLQELRPDIRVIVLGGPDDNFCQSISDAAQVGTAANFAGQLSLLESCSVLLQCRFLVSADTGLLHAADQMRRPCLALIGPTAFGYPSQSTSLVYEIDSRVLPCKPCSKDGRGRCTQITYQKCMVDLQPDQVARRVLEALSNHEKASP
jgi:heptosyltransferase-2